MLLLLPALGVIGIIILLIAQIFWSFQLAEVGINVLNPAGGGFMDTSNFWAWVVVFVLIASISGVIRLVFRLINFLLSVLLAFLFSLPTIHKNDFDTLNLLSFSSFIIWLGWLIAGFFLTSELMKFFSHNPQLNSWLAEGNWLAHVLVYLAILGLVCPTSRDKD